MKQHRNLPFFVPHAGCPCLCVFCSQGKITGKGCAEKDLQTELLELDTLLRQSADKGDNVQLAFFGGSFTAIEPHRRKALLELAHRYIKQGSVSSIRLSTRPDCLSKEILDELAFYGVTDIELGVQSVSDDVLLASGRGCTAAQCEAGCRAVVADGRFNLGGQMMIGLPHSTLDSEIATAKAIVAYGANQARIYPTVVFADTELYDMALDGRYTPLCLSDAVSRTAACAEIFIDAGVTLLRIGLHASEELSEAPFGATHPAMGELVMARVFQNRIERQINHDISGKNLYIYVPNGDVSKLTGHGGTPIAYLKNKYHPLSVTVRQADLPYMTVRVEVKE